MRDVNEVLATLFQTRAERDKDGVFHYLLKEGDEALIIDTTPYGQWTAELLEKTLIIDVIDEKSHLIEDINGENEVGVCWISGGTHRGAIKSFPVDRLLYEEDEDNRNLVIVGSDLIIRIDLLPDDLSFWVGPRSYFYDNIYDEQSYRDLLVNRSADL